MSPETTLPRPGARWLAIGALATLLVVACSAPALAPRTAAAADPTPTAPEHTISVGGYGQVSVTPDVADLQLGVQVTKDTVAQARAAAADAMTKAIAALKAAGIAERDIQTTTLSLQPVYDYASSGSQPRLIGYQVTNSVSATIRDLDRIADAVDGAMAAGATTVNGITFRLDNPAAAESQARAAAMANARAKANELASAAGVTIVGVASITESSSPTPTPIPYLGAAAGSKADVATPVQPGVTDVTVTVSVAYLID